LNSCLVTHLIKYMRLPQVYGGSISWSVYFILVRRRLLKYSVQ
jgi:hypothetical protein